MELIKKVLSDEYMSESQSRMFQLRVGMTSRALDAGKSTEEIADILKADADTAEKYIGLIKAARNRELYNVE